MKKTIFCLLITGLLFGNTYAKAVYDDNSGHKGDILIHSRSTKKTNIGTWTDIKTVPELKGDKGDTGEQGTQGKIGINGEQGIQGIAGKHFNPKEVNRLDDRINETNNRVNALEETQQIIGLEGRIYDSEKWQVNIFADYSTNRNKFDRTGIRFTYKFCESYENKQIKKLEELVRQLEGLVR